MWQGKGIWVKLKVFYGDFVGSKNSSCKDSSTSQKFIYFKKLIYFLKTHLVEKVIYFSKTHLLQKSHLLFENSSTSKKSSTSEKVIYFKKLNYFSKTHLLQNAHLLFENFSTQKFHLVYHISNFSFFEYFLKIVFFFHELILCFCI